MRSAIIPNVKIAVVDHEQLTREFIINVMMYSVNREVLSFEDAEGLKAYLKAGGNVHLILSEIHLPGESGFKLLQHIKREFPQVVFIAISANPADEIPAAELDADAYLAKPFVLKDLFDIVQKFVVEG
jgi:CheY-like chemotaxis protein